MAQDDIQGTITDPDGNAIEGAIVEVLPAGTDGSVSEPTAVRTTTDSNGDFLVNYHPSGDGTTQDWVVNAYVYDSTNDAWVPLENRPGVEADLGTVIPDSGVSRLTFDDADTDTGTALDVWGSNNGVITGATTGVGGIAAYDSGEAYEFSGGDEVNLGDPTNLNFGTGAFSIGGWFNTDDASTRGDMINKQTASGTFHGYFIGVDSGGFRYAVEDSEGDNAFGTGVGSVTTGTDIFAVLTWSGTEATLYRDDATVVDTANNSGVGDIDNTIDVRIGNGEGGFPFDGIIDDPRFYSKELSSTEVSNWYNTGSISG